MDKCIFCNKKTSLKRLIKLRNIQIYQCNICGLAFLDSKGIKEQKKIISDINYSFDDYRLYDRLQKERFLKLFNIIKKYKRSGSFLDIGAGFGLFAQIFAENNYMINVVEPINKLYYLEGFEKKAFKMDCDDFLRNTKEKYDVISMIDIIEHLKNPNYSLELLKQHMNMNSILVIQTPNYKSLMAFLCKKWSWWMIEDHKFFFTPKTLKNLMYINGYTEIYSNTYEEMEAFKKNLDGNFADISNNLLRKTYKAIYYLIFFPLYLLTRRLFWHLGLGGLIFAIYKKNE